MKSQVDRGFLTFRLETYSDPYQVSGASYSVLAVLCRDALEFINANIPEDTSLKQGAAGFRFDVC